MVGSNSLFFQSVPHLPQLYIMSRVFIFPYLPLLIYFASKLVHNLSTAFPLASKIMSAILLLWKKQRNGNVQVMPTLECEYIFIYNQQLLHKACPTKHRRYSHYFFTLVR